MLISFPVYDHADILFFRCLGTSHQLNFHTYPHSLADGFSQSTDNVSFDFRFFFKNGIQHLSAETFSHLSELDSLYVFNIFLKYIYVCTEAVGEEDLLREARPEILCR